MYKELFCLLAFIIVLTVGSSTSTLGADFYQGKTIRFVVGYSPGGGYDTYGRLVARHISKHIPGNPTTTVENMAGAGSLLAANYTYNKAEPDGLTVGVWNAQNLFLGAMGDPAAKLDGRKLGWIGTPGSENVVCAIMGFTGLKTFDDIRRAEKPITMGATRGGNTVHLPRMLNKWGGTQFKVITGYKGTAKMRLAMQGKEVEGGCWTWDSMRSTARAMLDAKGNDKLIPFIINEREDDPELKDVALFGEVFKGKDREAFEIWNGPGQMSRPFSLPPGTPKERVGILRAAFKTTLEDPAFLADVQKAKFTVKHIPGEKVEEIVKRIYSIPPDVKDNLQFLMPKRKKKS